MPMIWTRSDADDLSDKGLGGDSSFGQDSGDIPPSQVDGDTEMTIAPGCGAVGGTSLAAVVQTLLIGRAVTPINPRSRTLGFP